MISKWKKPDLNICDLATLEFFKKQILTFIRPRQYSTFKLHNLQEIKLRTLLRVGLSHLKEQKFKHNFHDSIGSWCSCGNSIKSTIYFFFHYADYTFQRQTVLNILCSTDPNMWHKKKPLSIKCSYLENWIVKTHFIKDLLTSTSASYSQ